MIWSFYKIVFALCLLGTATAFDGSVSEKEDSFKLDEQQINLSEDVVSVADEDVKHERKLEPVPPKLVPSPVPPPAPGPVRPACGGNNGQGNAHGCEEHRPPHPSIVKPAPSPPTHKKKKKKKL